MRLKNKWSYWFWDEEKNINVRRANRNIVTEVAEKLKVLARICEARVVHLINQFQGEKIKKILDALKKWKIKTETWRGKKLRKEEKLIVDIAYRKKWPMLHNTERGR